MWIETFDKVDRLVDIINARREKKVEFINSPQHKHVYELFSVLQLFEDWKNESSAFEYITRESYEDLKWMVFGMAGLACTYMKEDKSLQINQWRSGSDVCEHTFAKIRQSNTNPNAQQAREILSKVSASGAVSASAFMPKSKTNTAGAQVEPASYFEEMPTNPKKKKRKTE